MWPIWIPSRGRPRSSTARVLAEAGLDFRIAVLPEDEEAYVAQWGESRVAVLPFQSAEGAVPSRNWIWEQAVLAGAAWHWQLDDNISRWSTCTGDRWKRRTVPPAEALEAAERLAARYRNVGIVGHEYEMFGHTIAKPFTVNRKVYSSLLIRTDLPFRWRGRYNADVDLCLQALTSGWCTIRLQGYLADKRRTLEQSGGNTPRYQGTGRLAMADEIVRRWPGLVSIRWRWGRPQHYVRWDVFRRNPRLQRIQ